MEGYSWPLKQIFLFVLQTSMWFPVPFINRRYDIYKLDLYICIHMEYGDGVMEVMERNGICYTYGVDGTPNGRVPIYNF